MDLVFLNIRVGLFFMDHEIIKTNISEAKEMLEMRITNMIKLSNSFLVTIQ